MIPFQYRLRNYASVIVAAFAHMACDGGSMPTGRADVSLLADSIQQLSAAFVAQIGDGIGEAIHAEARFLGDRHIVFMDRFPPHLRLFTVDGVRIWKGAPRGGGPRELDQPQALAVAGDTVFAIQRGRISRWVLQSDSLAFEAAIPLPLEYAPLGAVPGCDDGLLFYARNDRIVSDLLQEAPERAATIQHLFSITFRDDRPNIEPVWGAEGEPLITPYTGHTAVLIGRTSTTIAVLHRWNAWEGGSLLQLDCAGRLMNAYSERALATGDSLRVHIPRPYVLQWTGGIVALPTGLATAIHRLFHPAFHNVSEQEWKTEIFGFSGGKYRGSIVVHGQWVLMDYHPTLGVLMASNDPMPHFVRVPESLLITLSPEG